jgi:protein-disulfide isomerase
MALPLTRPIGTIFDLQNEKYNSLFEQEKDFVKVECFLDLQCFYSGKGWSNLQSVFKYYNNQKVKFVIHLTCLADHYYSFLLSVGATAIKRIQKKPEDYWNYITLVFQNQELFNNNNTLNKTRQELINELASLIEKHLQIKKEEFIKTFNHDDVFKESFKSWQYAVSRGINGTPKFIINDFLMHAIESNWDLEKWKQLLDPLLHNSK